MNVLAAAINSTMNQEEKRRFGRNTGGAGGTILVQSFEVSIQTATCVADINRKWIYQEIALHAWRDVASFRVTLPLVNQQD